MSFNVGDRVRVIRAIAYGPPVGLEGTVSAFNGPDACEVDFASAWQNEHWPHNRKVWFQKTYIELATVRNFHLVAIRDGKEVALPDHPTFDTGKEAAAYAVQLSAKIGLKVQPRRIEPTGSDWRQREQARLDNGTYTRLPESWDLEPIADHFLHISKKDSTMLCYTESEEKGVLDRQTPINPGRYLQRFYGHLDQETMKRYIAMVDNTNTLKFAKTADEIERVYVFGPSSCMSGPHQDSWDEDLHDDCESNEFDSYCHPVRAYGDSDLQVAYLEKGKRVTARAVVWPEKKIWIRLYGDEARLRNQLEFEGYRSGSIVGARIRRLWDDNMDGFVVPYIDGNTQELRVLDKDYLVIDPEGNILGNSTEGISFEAAKCPKTGNVMWDNDDGYTVVVSVDPYQTERWCYDAYEEYAIEHYSPPQPGSYYGRSAYFAKDICTQIGNPDDDEWVPNHLMNGGYDKCAITGWTYPLDRLVTLADGRKVNREDFYDDGGFTCEGNGKNYLGSEAVEKDGKVYSKAFIQKRAEANARRRERRAQLKNERQAAIAA